MQQSRFQAIQTQLRSEKLSGWLLYDFRGLNPIAQRIAPIPSGAFLSRRWAYWIPSQGDPAWLVHAIETHPFAQLPARIVTYSSRHSLEEGLLSLTNGPGPIACEYSPECNIPYVSYLDAGTMDLLRSLGYAPHSSADLVQRAYATWTPEQVTSHRRAAQACLETKDAAFTFIADRLRSGRVTTEWDVQQYILARFQQLEIDPDHPPIVAVNATASNPHYTPTAESHHPIRPGDLILIDLWGREKHDPDAIFADMTWMGFAGQHPPTRMTEVMAVVARARDAAISLVQARISEGMRLEGWEVDDVARKVIADAGYGDAFFHRTGHSIDVQIHGAGVHMDNLETHDTRPLIPGIGFTIEPGIYLPDFGVRLEINMFVHEERAEITTLPLQYEFVTMPL